MPMIADIDEMSKPKLSNINEGQVHSRACLQHASQRRYDSNEIGVIHLGEGEDALSCYRHDGCSFQKRRSSRGSKMKWYSSVKHSSKMSSKAENCRVRTCKSS